MIAILKFDDGSKPALKQTAQKVKPVEKIAQLLPDSPAAQVIQAIKVLTTGIRESACFKSDWWIGKEDFLVYG